MNDQSMRRRRAVKAAALSLAGMLALAALPGFAAPAACASEPITVGYFPAWGVYDRHYLIQQVERSGAAERLDLLAYAFATIGADDLVALADPAADIEQPYSAATSLDGSADQPGAGVLRGSFNQLRKLKLLHPALKLVISIGGWNGSARFSDLAADQGRRRAFAASCIERLIAGNFSPGVRQAGLFDGLDIDWEYPATAGASPHARAEDARNFTTLLAELRTQLDQRGAADARRYLLTAALPATPAVYRRLELGEIHRSLDLLLLMTYDYHGAWDGRTGPLAALHPAAGDPLGDGQLCSERAIADYLAAGVPAAKLVLGVPFYGHGWQGVAPGPQGDGLYQGASGPAKGSTASGSDDYRNLAKLGAGTRFFDPGSVSSWYYDPVAQLLWSYDDAQVVGAKRAFAAARGLGGVMCWELSGDDDAGTLIHALRPQPARAPPR
jgi:chitinase